MPQQYDALTNLLETRANQKVLVGLVIGKPGEFLCDVPIMDQVVEPQYLFLIR